MKQLWAVALKKKKKVAKFVILYLFAWLIALDQLRSKLSKIEEDIKFESLNVSKSSGAKFLFQGSIFF